MSAKANEAKDKAEAFKAQRAQRHDRCFTLLVIDDQNTDWSKVRSSFKAIQMRNNFDARCFCISQNWFDHPQYFRGKKIHTDWDLRVEQAEFKELTVTQFLFYVKYLFTISDTIFLFEMLKPAQRSQRAVSQGWRYVCQQLGAAKWGDHFPFLCFFNLFHFLKSTLSALSSLTSCLCGRIWRMQGKTTGLRNIIQVQIQRNQDIVVIVKSKFSFEIKVFDFRPLTFQDALIFAVQACVWPMQN